MSDQANEKPCCSDDTTDSAPQPCCEAQPLFTIAPESCCSGDSATPCAAACDAPWVDGAVETPRGPVPRAATTLTGSDRWGTVRARIGVGRMHYTVPPGLYAVGDPSAESAVFVSANYKMSFDRLRSQLAGRDGWILVLDTKGINVWCAAGKGTFGTDEIVTRAAAVGLAEIVSHRKLIVPQLGAPGVSAHEVKKRSSFSVVYGPVRAEDLPAFLDAGMKATPEMRLVTFPLADRAVLVPVDIAMSLKNVLLAMAALFVLAGLGRGGYSVGRMVADGGRSVLFLLSAYLAGTVLTPLALPWLPGRAFSIKGAAAGGLVALALVACSLSGGQPFGNGLTAAAWYVAIPAVASFMGMGFTGASTYTSLSGVKREMRIALPAQIICVVAAAGLWIAGRFV